MNEIVKISVSLLPVFVFLFALILLDSFKMIRRNLLIGAIISGCMASLLSYYVNNGILNYDLIKVTTFTRYIAPVVEELLKAAFVIYIIKFRRVGFLVDAAICGFAVGAGFALIENIYYLMALDSSNLALWILRGFGTAIIHGSTTAILAIISMNLSENSDKKPIWFVLPGFALAVFIHSIYNHFILPPLLSTLSLLVILPPLIILIFQISEKKTRHWLGVGLDNDAQLLEMIINGKIIDSRIGKYLETLIGRFPGPVVADMLCYLRIYLELSIRAKGILLMREAGIKVTPDIEINEKLTEMKFLEKSIGKTGKLAISPFLYNSSRDLWQIYMLPK